MLAANGFDLLATILLTVTVILVAFFDLRERRIPNNIVFPAALTGLVLNGLRGWAGLWFGSKGLLAGFGLLFIPYLFRVMGAGDVKFLAAIGSFVGVSGVAESISSSSNDLRRSAYNLKGGMRTPKNLLVKMPNLLMVSFTLRC